MRERNLVAIVSSAALGFSLALAGCGDFGADDPEEETASGGTGTGTGGSEAGTGGADSSTGGSVAQTPPEPSCDNVVGCGGDAVVDTWFAQDEYSCLTVSGMADLTAHGIGCVEAEAEGTLHVSGNWAVNEDGTLVDNTQTTGTVSLVLAPECKDVSGTVTQCDALAGPLWASLGFVRDDSSCVDSETVEGGCDCTGTLNQAGAPGFVAVGPAPEGIYTIEGNTLTFTGYDVIEYDYCVDGNFMHMTPTRPNDIGTVTGTIVFERQP